MKRQAKSVDYQPASEITASRREAFSAGSPTSFPACENNSHSVFPLPAHATHCKLHVLFLSSCPEPWGGSEELWAGAARRLRREGHPVSVCKTHVVADHPRIGELRADGIAVEEYWKMPRTTLLRALVRDAPTFLFQAAVSRGASRREKRQGKADAPNKAFPAGAALWKQRLKSFYQHLFVRRLQALAPEFAVISQGENFDGLHYAEACRKSKVPYVLICQKACDWNWPADTVRPALQRAFQDARRVYFVSEHNRALTERQIGRRLSNAEVVRNPYLTNSAEALPYPETSSGVFRLACVARLYLLDKGQDILLEVLAQEKWRQRPLQVNFYGEGIHREALESAGEMLGLHNVFFHGFAPDIMAVWRGHHALVLPSRAEGMPLALVEAMMCGRPGIVTNVGGNAEVVDDEQTGFLAKGMDAASLDEVLERAWSRRREWKAIGLEAARRIRQRVPPDPCGSFTSKLITVMTQSHGEDAHART